MANEVYANNMEVSCKAAAGKSIACFPDVCFTPPQAPPTPTGVPIPYPNTGMAKDTTNGTRTVKITGKEVMLKDKSYFKTSYGDEAGNAPKKGVITNKIKGRVYFTSWSMDVKFEGKNVVRNMDLTTHNHGSNPGNTPPTSYSDGMVVPKNDPNCKELQKNMSDEHNNLPKSINLIHVGDGPGKPSTLAVADIQESNKGHSGVSASKVIASRKAKWGGKYANYAKGIKRGQASNVRRCGDGEPFVYNDKPPRPVQGHAEAKIIEAWFKKSGSNPEGVLLINVSRPCCADCARLIRWVNCGKNGAPNCHKIKVCENHQDNESLERLRCEK
ncbi:DUF4150 domain-containing protein [Pseudomonas chlororaphis]|nr:DUF4150 domain-containing protein [Pseudomonas chlororaphis]AZC31742.1 hypothetical protein C4K38_3784 [Pseudomonas chlororaphis subsp. piscium]WDG77706.1 DUF4150 domain-containing protein [Pseudomonas chlororaphis]WDG83057.1 DUF4150 domain-containing protein [Pseudomonas chlororaphis]WDG89515.1 DUF4150 domain-containing protein [Pseudomonas chlororaphis]SDS83789.1 protein of unknown function [Pseudomonas chlororaphis]